MCFEEEENVHERIAVAVTSMERFVLDHLQREISNLLRLFIAVASCVCRMLLHYMCSDYCQNSCCQTLESPLRIQTFGTIQRKITKRLQN